MKRKGAMATLVVALVLGVLLFRVFWDGAAALRAGDRALEEGNVPEAVFQWRRAARWYAPGAPHVTGAYDRLETLATQAEAEGKLEMALSAWRGVRSSIKATRSFYTPFPERLERANEHIAHLMARLEDPRVDPERTEAERENWHLSLLSRSEAPSVGWTLLALLGFAGWVGGGFLFAFRGITAEDTLDRQGAVVAGVLIAAGLLLWMLGLYLA